MLICYCRTYLTLLLFLHCLSMFGLDIVLSRIEEKQKITRWQITQSEFIETKQKIISRKRILLLRHLRRLAVEREFLISLLRKYTG